MDNYLTTVVKDYNDGDAANDVIVEAPVLEQMLNTSGNNHAVPSLFDQRTILTSEDITTYNILETTVRVSFANALTRDNIDDIPEMKR